MFSVCVLLCLTLSRDAARGNEDWMWRLVVIKDWRGEVVGKMGVK